MTVFWYKGIINGIEYLMENNVDQKKKKKGIINESNI